VVWLSSAKIAMTKSKLVRKLAEANPGLYHHDVEAIVTLIFEQIGKLGGAVRL